MAVSPPKKNLFAAQCNNKVIQNVKKVKYLGLQLDEELSGESIVNEISKKVNSRLRFLYRYKDYLNTESRKTLCTALIQCHFDYSCSSWFPGINKSLSNKLQVLQNRMVRFILNLWRKWKIMKRNNLPNNPQWTLYNFFHIEYLDLTAIHFWLDYNGIPVKIRNLPIWVVLV